MFQLGKKSKSVLLLLVCGIGLGVMADQTNIRASAKDYHTSPRNMRGTWYNYHSDMGYTKIKLTAHTMNYRNNSAEYHAHEYIPKSKFVATLDNKKTHLWVFHNKDISAAFSTYRYGKMKINGKYHPILVEDGFYVFTHFKTKHQYKVPKHLRSIQSGR